MLVLFNLIAPVGWRLGLVRVTDVAIGAAISVVAGVLLWPHGARGEFRRAVAALYRAVAAFLADALSQVLEHGSAEDTARARRVAVQAHDRAGEAFDQFLRERGAKPLDPQVAAALVAVGAHAIVAGDLLDSSALKGYRVEGPGRAHAALHDQAHALVSTFAALADRLGGATQAGGAGERVSDEVLRDAALRILRGWRGGEEGGSAAIAAVAVAEWIHLLGRLTASLEAPVAATVAAARVPWWR